LTCVILTQPDQIVNPKQYKSAILSFRHSKQAFWGFQEHFKGGFLGQLWVYYHVKSLKTREMKFAIPLNFTPYDAN
jgi:hypothetical protein